MPTTDQNTGGTTTSSNNQNMQNTQREEFDLDMLGETSTPEKKENIENISDDKSGSSDGLDSLDFNIDLPDSYPDDSVNNEDLGEKRSETSIDDINSSTTGSDVQKKEEGISNSDFSKNSPVEQQPYELENPEPQANSSYQRSSDIKDSPQNTPDISKDFSGDTESSTTETNNLDITQPDLSSNSESIAKNEDAAASTPTKPMFSDTQSPDETFIPDSSNENGGNTSFSKTADSSESNNQPTLENSLISQNNNSSPSKLESGEPLSDSLNLGDTKEFTTAEPSIDRNPLLEDPTPNDTQDNLNIDTPLKVEPQDAQAVISQGFESNEQVWETTQELPVSDQTDQNDQSLSGTLNLDDMIAQNDQSASFQSSEVPETTNVDPFLAMKSTLETKNTTSTSMNQDNDIDKPTLDLSTVAVQDVGGTVVSQMRGNTSKLVTKGSSKKLTYSLLSLLLVVAAVVIGYIRYPDYFSALIGGVSVQTPSQTDIVDDHGSAPIENTGSTITESSSGNTAGVSSGVEVLPEGNEGVLEEVVTPISVDEKIIDGDEDILVLDLSQDTGTTIIEDNPVDPSTTTDSNPGGEEPGAVDPLAAIEGVVGPVNNNELIKQEVLEYQSKGFTLKDQGASNNNKTMYKYGSALEAQAKNILEKLEKGEDMDISSWTEQKAIFDEYIGKANA